MFKIKDGCKFKLRTLEAMKLFDTTKRLIDIAANGENVPRHEVAEAVLV